MAATIPPIIRPIISKMEHTSPFRKQITAYLIESIVLLLDSLFVESGSDAIFNSQKTGYIGEVDIHCESDHSRS
jgi:hypothetical protein